MNGIIGITNEQKFKKNIGLSDELSKNIKRKVQDAQNKTELLKKISVGDDLNFLTANLEKKLIEFNSIIKNMEENPNILRYIYRNKTLQANKVADEMRKQAR